MSDASGTQASAEVPPLVPLRRNRGFRMLWTGQLLSGTGTELGLLAYPLLILALTHSAVLAGLAGTARAVTVLCLQLPAGALSDRFDRRLTMIVCDVMRAVLLAVLAIVVAVHLASWPVVMIVGLVEGGASAIFSPASAAALPAIVPDAQLEEAWAATEARTYAAGLAGPALGGVLFGLGRALPFLADAVSYAASFGTVSRIRGQFRPRQAAARKALWHEVADGLRCTWQVPVLRAVVITAPLVNFAFTGVLFTITLALRQHGTSSAVIGLVQAAVAVGGLLGAVVAPRLQRRMSLSTMVTAIDAAGAVLFGVAALLIPSPLVAVPVALALLLTPAVNAALVAVMLRSAPEEMRGRVNNTVLMAATALAALAPLTAGLLVEHASGAWATGAFAATMAVAAALGRVMPGLRQARSPAGRHNKAQTKRLGKVEASVMTGQRTMAATVSGPVTGGRGWPFGSPADAGRHGYVIEEFLLDGVAQSYEPVPGTVVGRDGRWTVRPGERAGYRTRMYVARPADPARFNGVVIAYWLNVTAGFDLGAPTEHDMRAGYAWAGITTQAVAVNGQPSLAPGFPATPGLPRIDPARYGTLHHPGDAYSFDIFTQAARAVGPARPASGADPLGGLAPRLVLACGASQSAARLGAYLNMADDNERCFDGYLLLVHWGLCVYPPDQPMMTTFAALGDGYHGGSSAINDRGRVPVLVLNSESETLHNVPVRQPDSPTFRFWEIAGAAHTGESPDLTPMLEREGLPVFPPAPDGNAVDWRWVRNAALEHLVRWSDGGPPPPSFPLIDASLDAGIHRDETGNASGGIRVPELEAPTAVHAGSRPGNPLAALIGQSVPYPPARLAARYPDAAAYLRDWDAAVDRARDQGLLLDTDLEELRQRGRKVAAGLW